MSSGPTDFRQIYEQYAADVYRFALWLSGDRGDAEDITSETFTRALASASPIRSETAKGYLFTIARRYYIEMRRREHREVPLVDSIRDGTPAPDAAVERTTELHAVRAALARLPEIDRTAAAVCLAIALVCWVSYTALRRRRSAVMLMLVASGLSMLHTPDANAQRATPTRPSGNHEFRIDAAHSTVEFDIPFAYSRVRGQFDDLNGAIVLGDSGSGGITASSVVAFIRTASINTGSAHRDDHLRSSDFFDAARYPTIAFRSQEVEPGAGGFTLVGELTMHGRTRVVRVPCRVMRAPTVDPHNVVVTIVTGSTALARRDFDILGGDAHNAWFDQLRNATMGDSVRITLEIHAWRPDPDNPPPGVRATIARIDSIGIDSAVAHLRSAFRRNSNDAKAAEYSLDLVGQTLLARGRVRDAFLWLHAIARLRPQSANAMVSVGVANERMGDRARATAWYQQAVAADSLSARAAARLMALRQPTAVPSFRPDSRSPHASRSSPASDRPS